MKKQLLLLLVLAALPITVWAGKVTREQALKTATDFMHGKTFMTAISYSRTRGVPQKENEEPFYVFNATDGGYVIVSGDDRTREILGYSPTGTLDIDSLPANLQWWLDEYARQIDALGTSTVSVKTSLTQSTASAISPLIRTQWNQVEPYNYMCPDEKGRDYYDSDYDASKRCYTGCTATAMAQVMNYWKWPESCPALKAYSTESFNVNSLPSTTFKWDLMKDFYGNSETGDAANAVAELMRYCGQAVEMDYGTSGSSGAFSKRVMVETFKYSHNIGNIDRDDYNLETWEKIIYNELTEGRPVLYSGRSNRNGHAFVVDGYFSKGLFHINWGWGGSKDDYFVLSAADPDKPGFDGGSSSKGYRYSQSALIGVKPFREGETEPYAVLSDDGHTVTFYYDGYMISRKGMALDDSNNKEKKYKTATTAVFDESFAGYYPIRTNAWFYNCRNLKEIKGISNLNTDYVTSMEQMFFYCSSLTSLDLSNFKTDNVWEMSYMFIGCSGLTSLDLSSFKTNKVRYMVGTFCGCSGLKSLDLSGFKTDNLASMIGLFWGCSGLTSLDLSNFKTDKMTSMDRVFSDCSGLTSLDLNGFKTDKVTYMGKMFYNCSGLTSLDLSSFKTDNVTNMDLMFSGCSSLTTIHTVDDWNIGKVEHSSSMFSDCTKLIGGQGTKYDPSHDDHTYARIDGGVDSPGYFTSKEGSSIHVVNIDSISVTENIYDVKGLKHDNYTKGLNIVRMSNGTTKKVVVK